MGQAQGAYYDPDVPNPPRRVSGACLAQYLRTMPVSDHKPFLAFLEQWAKRRVDLEMLRELQEYRRNHLDRPT